MFSSLKSMLHYHILEKITKESESDAIGSVIWLHGLGADGHDFADIVPQLQLPKQLPIRFVFPHAPMRPVTLNAQMRMRAWYDIYSLQERSREDEAGILQAEQSIRQLIHDEIARGIVSSRIILAGFSQGGAMALFTGLRYEKPLAGIIALSTYLPLADRALKEAATANAHIPIFMAHGNTDTVLPITLGQTTYHLLKQRHYPVEWHEYSMAHQVCTTEITAIGNWLTQRFA